MRMYLLTLLAVFGGAAAHAQSFADYPQARIDSYFVRGTTAAEIFASITRNAPGMIHAGQPAHAYAKYQFHWRLRSRGSWCEAEVKLDLSVMFPQHVDPAGLSNTAWSWWNKYSLALEMHEAGHLQLAEEAYPELLAALENGPCETANARAEAVLADLDRRQDLYDQMTNHGAVTSHAFDF
ncbi:MAG: DUF922 domain-containing protein [Pseudomonadota bacterium]